MVKRVILTLMPGSFEQGFPVILRIREDGTTAETRIQVLGKLPPAPNIVELFQQWQVAYRQMVMPHSRIKPKLVQVTNFSCRELGSQLAERLNDWLNSGSREWQRLRDRLQQNLSETDEIQVIIETDDIRLRQLPWHLWDLFYDHYTLAEIALSAPEYQPPRARTAFLTDKVRILAILGNSTGIDVQKDRAMLEQLPNAETTFLVEPQRQELNNQLWDQRWKILFFAGHSSSQGDGNTGQIYINQTDSLSLTELKHALRKAIERGLQLAIFNSCDGLGLAQSLADLHIPQVIVMREPVPDLVAQEFLKHFLATFSAGQSLYVSVREARERLQKLEGEYPCATWLPVICQNPAQEPTSWQEWCGVLELNSATARVEPQHRPPLPSTRSLRTAFLASGQHVASKPSSLSVSTSTNRLSLIIGLGIVALISVGEYAYLQWQSHQGTSSSPPASATKTYPPKTKRSPTPSAKTTNSHTTERSPTPSATTTNSHTTERSPTPSATTTNSAERSSTPSATTTNPPTTERSSTSVSTETNPPTTERSSTSVSTETNPPTTERSSTSVSTKTYPPRTKRSPMPSATTTNPPRTKRSSTSVSTTPLPATPEPSPTASATTPLPATPEPSPTASATTPLPATPEPSPTASATTPLPATPEPSPTASATTPLPATPEPLPTASATTPLPATPEPSPTGSDTTTNSVTPKPSPTGSDTTALPVTPKPSPTGSDTTTNSATPKPSPTGSDTTALPVTPKPSPTGSDTTTNSATPKPSPTGESKTPNPATPEFSISD